MSRLGDHFPLGDREDDVGRELRPGMVLYLDAAFTNPPKPKYVLLACLDPRPVVLVINSQVNPNVESDPARAGRHVKLSAADYAFLQHDSYLDCSKGYSIDCDTDVSGQLVCDLSRIKGELCCADRQSVVTTIRTSATIPMRIRKAIEAAVGYKP